MMTTPPSGNGRNPRSGTNQPADFDAADYMRDRFERMFGAHNYPPEMQQQMAQREAELDRQLSTEAQEMLDSIARLSIVPAQETKALASNSPKVSALNSGKRNAAEHAFWIKRVLSEFDEDNFRSKWVSKKSIAGYINGLTDTQYNRVTELMHQYPTLHVHSQLYVRDCLRTFASRNDDDLENLYELLMLGYAIYPVLNAVTRKISLDCYVMEGKQIARGIAIHNSDDSSDVDDPQKYEQMAALLKFAFCLQVTDNHPGNGIRYVRPMPHFDSDSNCYSYRNYKLVEVIRQYASKVDQMIAFSEQHHDIDPEKLRALVEGRPIPKTSVKI